jgi:hypothetical protein
MATYKWFKYNNNIYNEYTKLIFRGNAKESYDKTIFIDNEELMFINRVCAGGYQNSIYFIYNNKYYYCEEIDFLNGIVAIGTTYESKKHLPQKEKVLAKAKKDEKYAPPNKEYYIPSTKEKKIIWDDWMVAKTIWYIIVMLAAVIFNDRIGIWIIATWIWWSTTIKNAPRA